MAFILKDRVKESTTTTGTGNISLGGSLATFDTFQTYLSNGDTTFYAIAHTASGVDEWEVGLGTWNTGNTLSRTTVLAGSNGTSAVAFSAGTKDVFMTYPASKAIVSGENAAFASITVTGTVDGRDIAADGTKLDGVEASADVTDTVNVTSAGALMRSGGTMTGNLVLNANPSSALGAATKQYVDTEVSSLVDSAPSTLDTLNELAAALGDDANFSTTVTNSIATKLPLSGGTMTGHLYLNGGTARLYDADGSPLIQQSSGATYVGSTGRSTLRLATSGSGNLYHRDLSTDYTIFTDNYHPNADKWTTARTLSLSGDASGSVSWDGSANATLSVAVSNDSHTHAYNNLTSKGSGTGNYITTGQYRWGSGSGTFSGNPRSAVIGYSGGNYGQIGYGWHPTGTSGVHTSQIADLQSRIDLYDGIVVYGSGSTQAVGSTVSWTELLDCKTGIFQYKNNNIFHDGYHPNADTLTTARTINGVSFDGSANITVADSTKLPLAGGTITGDLQAAGLYVGTTNTSYDFYNNGTSYLNGATTIDANTQINGHLGIGGTATDASWGDATYGNTEVSIDGGGGYGVLHFRGDGAGSTDTRYSVGVGDSIFYMAYDDVDGVHRAKINASHQLILNEGSGDVRAFHDSYHPNADTLTTARTINGVSFNGSANITVADSTKLPLSGGTMTGDLTINEDGDSINLRSTTNAASVGISFSSQNPTPSQFGHIRFNHADTLSYGSGALLELGSTESTTTILADGKLMYDEGIYSKPASGTGAGTRKDANWDTAYTTANAALPKAGGTMTGELNVTHNGGATGSSAPTYSQANIELQTSSNHAPAISFHRGGYSAGVLYEYDGQIYSEAWVARDQDGLLLSSGNISSYAWTSGNDGSGSGLDADLLDGVHGSSFLRSDADDTTTHHLTFSDSGYSIGNEYHTWKRSYVVNQGNPDELLYRDGNSLPNGGAYRFHAHIDGTGTDQSATAVFWNQNGTWKLNVTYQSGSTSNNPEFIIHNSKPHISIDHTSNYTVQVLGERMELTEGSGTDNKSGFGADAYLSVNNTTLRYNPSGAGPIDTGDLIWHAGNDGSGSGLDADLLDGVHGSAFARKDSGVPDFQYGIQAGDIYLGTDGDTDGDYNLTLKTTGNNTLYLNHGGTGHVDSLNAIYAPQFYDRDNSSYYVDPASTSNLNKWMSGSANGNSTAPRYDTSAYVLQSQHWYGHNSGQGMYLGESGNDVYVRGQMAIGGTAIESGYALTMTGSIDMNNSEINYLSQVHFQDNVRFVDEGNNQYLRYKAGSTGGFGIKFYNGSDQLHGYVYGDGAGSNFGLLANDGSWAVQCTTGKTTLHHRLDTPLMYDSDDTAYYVNSANNSVMNQISLGVAGNGQNTKGRFISLEGNADSSGEGSGRIFFSEHNSTTASMDAYGMSMGYRGGGTSITGVSGNAWTGLSQISNGQWGMWGHDANATGALIMYGDRGATFVNFASNDINGIGTATASNSFRAPIFYDSNDTAYYGNFADTGDSAIRIAGSMRVGSQKGLYTSDSWIRMKTASGYIDIGPANSGHAHIYTDRTNFYMNKTLNIAGGTQLNTNDARANIFYDKNNTAYYFDGSATGDSIRVAGNIVAYYSDERLKDIEGNIDSPLEKVSQLNGFYYTANKKAQTLGYKDNRQVGVSAQEVEAVMPEVVTDAAIGHGYKTVDYAKLVPLLIEAVKEQQDQIETLKSRLEKLEN